LTDDPAKAKELLALAGEKGLYLGSAPDTFFGAAWQTARAAIDGGMLGDIHSFAISAIRDNTILLSMFSFLREPGAGILYDYAVYYLTALVSLLGPVARVGGFVGRPYPQHRNILPMSPDFGKMMDTPNESQVSAVLELRNGVRGTLHIDSDSCLMDRAYFAIYGTKGILYLTDPNQFGGEVKFLANSMDFSKPPEPLTLWNFAAYGDNARGIGPAEMAQAILEKRPNRASKEMAYHVLEVLSGILKGGEKGAFVDIASTCEQPAPLEGKAIPVRNIGHVSYNAKDMEAMLHFYCDVLGMEKLFTLTLGDLAAIIKEPSFTAKLLEKKDDPWIVYLKLAERQYVELFYDFGPAKKSFESRRDYYGYMKMNFEVDDIKALRERLTSAGVSVKEDIHPTLDGAEEVAVLDPDGNEVQFTQYSAADKRRFLLSADAGPSAVSGMRHITQVAYQVKDALNMRRFYCQGLGLQKAFTFTYADLRAGLEASGQADAAMLAGLQALGDSPWLDYIEVAPHQYLELFYTAPAPGQEKKEERNLGGYYGYQHICLEVTDIHQAWDAVLANGLKPDTGISLGPDGAYQFWLVDPDGNRLECMEYTATAMQLKG
jgi:predicted dehydrogenase/catechol 2,3-dioxygenase-like lactoylglutathione lyase family enzyme